jgi:HNH endonuclease
MARRAMAAPIGARLPEPLITVLVGYESLHGPVLELFNNGTVVTPGQIANLLSHADIERAVYDPAGRDITDLGRRARFYRGARRRVIEIRDRHCTFPGCTLPADRCDVDHVSPWAEGGETTQSNGRLRCSHHNRHRGHEDPSRNPLDPRLPFPTEDEDQGDDAWDDTVLDDEDQAADAARTEAAGTTSNGTGDSAPAEGGEAARDTLRITGSGMVPPPAPRRPAA